MLWYKSWLETRWRFLIGLTLLMLSAAGAVIAYPRVVKLLPLANTVDVSGEIGRRIKEGAERLKEARVVQQLVDFGEARRQAQGALRQDRLPQGRLRAYGSQHDGPDPFSHKGFGPSSRHSGPKWWTRSAGNPSGVRVSRPTSSG